MTDNENNNFAKDINVPHKEQMIIDGIDIRKCKKSQQLETQLQREKQNSQEAIDTSIKEFNRAETLKTLLTRKEQECEKYKQTIAEIKFWARELLKRTGQVVPSEIKQILQKINEREQ